MQRMGPINNNGYLSNKQQSPTAEEQPAGGSRSESATNTRTGGQGDIPNQIRAARNPALFVCLPPIRLLSALYFTGHK